MMAESRIALVTGVNKGQRRALMRTILVAVMMMLLWAVPCPAADSGFKQGAKEAGQEITEGTKEVGQKIKEEAKKVSQGIKEGITETKREAQKQGQTIGEWFRDTGKKTGEVFLKMGRNIRKFFTGK